MDLKVLLPDLDTTSYFHHLCREIIGQQLSGKVADVIYSRFLKLLKNKITPENILKVSGDQIRAIGLSWSKIKYIKDLATKTQNDEIEFTNFPQMDNESIAKELIKVKGIGPWTAEMFLIFTLGREDVFSFGDLGLKNGFKKIYHHDLDPKVIAKWSPYRSYACLALWKVLDG